ncbi:MAG: glutamate-5-semialdehyde dehydrogenase [Prochloraceae cyanobacterium]
MTTDSLPNSIPIAVQRAYRAFLQLGTIEAEERSRGVKAMAVALEKGISDILEANTLDLVMSREMAVPELILKWLKLTPERMQNAIAILHGLAERSDPMERMMNASHQLNSSQTYSQLRPLGAIAFVYEAFPELAAIAAGMCLKTSNSIILRGGSEASQTNTLIGQILQIALEEADLPKGCVETIGGDRSSSIQDLVSLNQYLSLVIPYGRPSLISQVSQLSTAPTIESAMGNCYLYWAASGDLELVRRIIIDSHASQPDPVNAIEKVLINSNQKSSSLIRLFSNLSEKGFQLRGDKALVAEFPERLTPVTEAEWSKSYLDKIIAFKKVETIESAIAWIGQYSSGHADCLITESYQESRKFATGLDSALIYINASPKFSRYPRKGESVFLGISNQKGYGRGLISLETFTTTKQIVQGEGII